MKVIVEWVTNYNGVRIRFEGYEMSAAEEAKLEQALEEMELPNLTYEMTEDLPHFDSLHLTDEQEEQLFDVVRNNETMQWLFGDHNVEFVLEYDRWST